MAINSGNVETLKNVLRDRQAPVENVVTIVIGNIILLIYNRLLILSDRSYIPVLTE